MKFEFKKSYDQQKALEYLKKLIDSESKCEVNRIHPKRSTDQNSYLHVLFKLWGDEFGYFMDETKEEVKYALGYYDQKQGGALHYHKTSNMDTKELTRFIDKFRDWSSVNGLYLPTSKEYLQEQIYFENQIENSL